MPGSYEQEKTKREARFEAELRRARLALERGILEEPQQEEEEEQEPEEYEEASDTGENEEQRESLFQKGKRKARDYAKDQAKKRLRERGKKELEKRGLRRGTEQGVRTGARTGARAMQQGANALGRTAASAAPEAFGGAAVAGGGTAVAGGGVAVAGGGAAAAGGAAAGGAAAAGGVAAGGAAVGGAAIGGGTILLIIAAVLLVLILLFFLIFFLVSIAPAAMCLDEEGEFSSISSLVSAAAEFVGLADSDICLDLAMITGSQRVPSNQQVCADPKTIQELAALNCTPYPIPQNSPELTALMACISNDVTLRGKDLCEVSTYDRSHPTCNFTRGISICEADGICSHAINSCHYGGTKALTLDANGNAVCDPNSPRNQGALAVDYGLCTNEATLGPLVIAAALRCGAKSARCEDANGATVDCSSPTATHVHVNSKSCDRN